MRYSKIRTALLAGCATVAFSPTFALAQSQPQPRVSYDIPAQDLGAALTQFGQQSEREIVFSADLARNKKARPVAGEMTSGEALAMLLADTGLTYRTSSNGSIIVEASDPQSGSAAGDGADSGTVQALIVTAQKREENIQDVPIAMSAFSQEALETHQIAGGPDLITQVPNMTFTKTNFSSYSIQLRGIGTQAISATTDAAVAVAFNNTPFIRNRFFEQEFYDLQRVEVLRGPQGTLYGRNATAGVVNIISQKPKFVAEAKLSGDLSNYSSSRLEGMINIPLVEDKVALRIAGAWTKRNGYATNQLTGNPIDGRDLWSTRVSLRVAPTDRLDMNLIWEHFEENDDRLRSGKQLCKKDVVTEVGGVPVTFDQGLHTSNLNAPWIRVQPRFSTGCERGSLYSPDAFQTVNGASVPYYVPLQGIGFNTPTFSDPYASQTQSQDLRVIESTVDPKYRAKSEIGEFQFSYDLTDSLKLTSETAYATDFVWSTQDFNRFNTVHGAWYDSLLTYGSGQYAADSPTAWGVLKPNGEFCDPQIGCSDRLVAQDLATANSKTFSQELRVGSDFDGPFNFSLGANFLRFDTEDKYYVFINTLTLTAAEQSTGSFISLNHAGGVGNMYIPNVSDNHQCLPDGYMPGDLSLADDGAYGYDCIYIDPNPIESLNDQGHNYFLSKNPYKLVSYAAFGEAYYNIADNLKLTAGLRWTVDKKEAPRIPTWTFAGLSRGYPVLEVVKQEWREPTGRLALDWKPDLSFTDQTLVYASYARGYKAGGSNPPPLVPVAVSAKFFGASSATRPKTFDAEYVDAFELGSKNTLLDGKLTLNLASFYYDYTGYQISEIVDRSAFNHNYDATVYGLEIEADWRPLENLKLGFKGGYEHARFKKGDQAIDLMDRTAGNPDWITIRPFPTFPSSCILPVALFTHNSVLPGPTPDQNVTVSDPGYTGVDDLGGGGGSASGGCEYSYLAGRDPVTNRPYVAWPTPDPAGGSNSSFGFWPIGQNTPGAYPGWNPAWAPNNGEGFYKNIGGNPLPNAPDFTATITADYTLPLPNEWLMTLHTDLYAQSNAYWRIFNDHSFDKLHPYFTMNLAAIFTNEDAGWKVMAYVKNVLDKDSLTGAFLNSDDTGLTTNVFLTEPRLYGLRVTKDWSGGPLWGSFGSRHNGPYPFEVELGGQIQRHDAPNEPLAPNFVDQWSAAVNPLADQQDKLDWGDGRSVKVTYRSSGDWKVALEARFGRTNGAMPWSTRSEVGDTLCFGAPSDCVSNPLLIVSKHNYSISDTYDREEHTVVDFTVGRDFGIGGISESSISGGVRYADLGSKTRAHLFGAADWNFQNASTKYDYYYYGYHFKFPTPGGSYNTHHEYDQTITADRHFKGAGPVLSWDASQHLLGNEEVGTFGLDWSLGGGVLFGKRKTDIHMGQATDNYYAEYNFEGVFTPAVTTTPAYEIIRSKSATIPTVNLSLGLSYSVDRFKLSTGYRWERYFNAIDGGFKEEKKEDRTIDGPYLKVSVGFGG
jgi:outer membrane receptor protein involved in Fe transport